MTINAISVPSIYGLQTVNMTIKNCHMDKIRLDTIVAHLTHTRPRLPLHITCPHRVFFILYSEQDALGRDHKRRCPTFVGDPLSMFDFLTRRKKQTSSFSPRQEINKLSELSPPSALLSMSKDTGDAEPEELGKAFFLRRDKKLYLEGDHFYLTTPDNLKIAKDQNLTSQKVFLQFMNKRIPFRLECKIIGRFRLLPEVVETLDFNAKSAYKLTPIGALKKQDKRQFFRYTLKNYGDSRVPLTTHISFELYIRKTDQEFPEDGAPPVMLKDLTVIDFQEQQQQPFTTRDAINDFRTLMLKKQPHERFVYASKVNKDESSSLLKRKDEELLLGEINILGLEMESLRDVLYLKKSAKASMKKGKDNPYGLKPGEKIITNFVHDHEYYQMLVEVMEARTQNEVVRPIDFPRGEEGHKTDLIDYSVGGNLIESSPELLKFLLGEKCPTNVDDEVDFTSEYWEKAFVDLQQCMLHLTFYPKLHFPDAVKRFKPELPFKICVLAQVVRTYLHHAGERRILQHGLQFCYEPQGIPLRKNDPVDWRYSRFIRDNEYFKTAHSQLSQLSGYLENQSLSSGADARRRRPESKE